MRVLVCGGRDNRDTKRVFEVLDGIHGETPISILIQGGAAGADLTAFGWAKSREVQCVMFPAEWDRHGGAAGPIRNQRMIDEGNPALCVAFPGGRGTADMVRRAKEAGVRVVVVKGE